MNHFYAIGAAIAACLLAYLIVSLLRAEEL